MNSLKQTMTLSSCLVFCAIAKLKFRDWYWYYQHVFTKQLLVLILPTQYLRDITRIGNTNKIFTRQSHVLILTTKYLRHWYYQQTMYETVTCTDITNKVYTRQLLVLTVPTKYLRDITRIDITNINIMTQWHVLVF